MGTRIKLSPLGGAPFHYDSPHDYAGIFVQGGRKGIVLGKEGSYRTAFIECSPEGSFIRGEGTTLEEADNACFRKLQAYLGCIEHVWEPRGYQNGAGFCKVCGQFGSGVFTAAQLELFCATCQEPTFHKERGTSEGRSVCEEHDVYWPYFVAYLEVGDQGSTPAHNVLYRKLLAMYEGNLPLDQGVLNRARKLFPPKDAVLSGRPKGKRRMRPGRARHARALHFGKWATKYYGRRYSTDIKTSSGRLNVMVVYRNKTMDPLLKRGSKN